MSPKPRVIASFGPMQDPYREARPHNFSGQLGTGWLIKAKRGPAGNRWSLLQSMGDGDAQIRGIQEMQ